MDTLSPTPAVSVLIPTKNRKQLLLDTVRSVLKQSVPVEVIIVDDGSTDGTTNFIRQSFAADGRVQVHRRETSGGPTLARNTAATLATTPYLFTIDDDCLVPSIQTFSQTLAAFDHPRIGAVTIPFVNVHQNTLVRFRAPDAHDRYISPLFFGGMVAFRRSPFEAVGGYRTHYFMHVEEPDMVQKLLAVGCVVRLGWADPIDHLESPVRNSKKILMLEGRNHVLYHWYNTPMPALLARIPVAAAGTMLHAIKAGRPDIGLIGIARGFGSLWHERHERRPLPASVHEMFRRIRFSTPTLAELEPLLPPLQTAAR